MNENTINDCGPVDISDSDILNAMKHMAGYIDITPGDFREVYRVAYRVAMDRLMRALTAMDVMTEPVVVVHGEMELAEVAKLLDEKKISGVPVVGNTGNIIGVISEKDFLKNMGTGKPRSFMGVISQCLENKGCIAIAMRKQKAADIMSTPAITAEKGLPISGISSLMKDKNINRIPIVDGDGKPVGIVTRADLVTSYCRSV